MSYYIDNMLKRMCEGEKTLLKNIYSPQVVAVPPSNACSEMCVTPEGEIRIYGAMNKTCWEDPGLPIYIASKDGGISWKTNLADAKAMGPAGYNPKTGRYIATRANTEGIDTGFEKGTYVLLNNEGFDCRENKAVRISDRQIHIMKLPIYLESIDRWFIIGQNVGDDGICRIVVFYSDDDGESWVENQIKHSAPRFEITPPHRGVRWQQDSCEPTIAELSNGDIIMIVRTSLDYHYMYISRDKGESWEEPVRSPFHGTITMPVLNKLSDGRILFFWCNTQPMPEISQDETWPRIDDGTASGLGEDVFTNRDANHMAISEDDGKTWIGFRELFLNTIRNNADFRSIGGAESNDKSVHQAQIFELPFNKILIHFGQNRSARKVVIFDIDWLYEQEREEDFRQGLENVSTQMYVKSNLGYYRGFSGHCAYNRTNGALLVRDPDGNFEEALQVCRVEDERLVYKKQGVVWNFPTSKQGSVEIKLRVMGSGVLVSLSDHWYNPADETVTSEAHFNMAFDEVNRDSWDVITLVYDTEAGICSVNVNGDSRGVLAMNDDAPHGISYLHIQTLAESEDYEGTLIKSLKKIKA